MTIFLMVSLVFYTGYMFGYRDFFNSKDDQTKIITTDGGIKNSLTEMVIKNILGSANSKDVKVYGQFYYKISKDQTEILIKIKNAPTKVMQAQNGETKQIPSTLKIEVAERTANGLSYDFTEIGKINFNEPQNNQYTAEFSTIVDFPFNDFDRQVERIFFSPENEEDTNLFVNSDPNLPADIRTKPSPYFWVVLD